MPKIMINTLKKSLMFLSQLLIVLVFASSSSVSAQTRQLTEREYRKQGGFFVGNYKANCTAENTTQTTNQKLSSGSSVFILGDSITVRSANSYTSAFKALGITANIDGSSSRSIKGRGIDGNKLSALDAVATPEDKAFITSASAIIIALGTNGGNSSENMTQLLDSIRTTSSKAPIYWVDTTVIGRPDYIPTIKASNEAIYSQATAQNFTTISWYSTVTPNGDPLNPKKEDSDANKFIVQADQFVHPTASGIAALTNLVVSSVASSGSNSSNQAASGCCTTVVSNDASLVGNDNVEKAYNFFVQKGLTPFQSAGIVGNMIAESGLIPRRLQYIYGKETGSVDIKTGIASVNADRASKGQSQVADSSFGFGIVQWTPYAKLVQTSLDAGKSYEEIDSLNYQLEQVWGQLIGDGILGKVSNLKSVGDKLKATTDIERAAFTFARYYEVFKNSWAFSDYGVKDQGQISSKGISASDVAKADTAFKDRVAKSSDVLKLYGGGAVGAGGTVISSASVTGCGNVTSPGENTRYVDGFTVYSQYDPTWKNKPYGTSTIGDAGCGPSVMAMIITTLTGQKVTPVETASYAAANNLQTPGGGSSWQIGPNLAKKWNLTSTKINADLSEISTALRAGSLIIASGTGAVPFTSAGHFIVIRGLTADGKFKVGDSAHDEANTTAYETSFILSIISQKAGSIYAISK